MPDINRIVTTQRIYEDVLANLGNRDDIPEDRIYRIIHYSQLAVARVTKWKDLTIMSTLYHGTWGGDNLNQDRYISFSGDSNFLDSGYPTAVAIRTILTFHLEDATYNQYKRLRRVGSVLDWQNMRMERLEVNAKRDVPTHYYFHSRTANIENIELFPVPDKGYTYSFSAIWLPRIYYGSTDYNEQVPLLIRNAEDIVTARATYLLALGLQLPDIAQFWKSEYDGLLKDLFLADKDTGAIDMAAFVQESDLRSGSAWWNDPFAKGSPGGINYGEQV